MAAGLLVLCYNKQKMKKKESDFYVLHNRQLRIKR